MLFKKKEEYSVLFRVITIGVVCLFLVNDFTFALAPQSKFNNPNPDRSFERRAGHTYSNRLRASAGRNLPGLSAKGLNPGVSSVRRRDWARLNQMADIRTIPDLLDPNVSKYPLDKEKAYEKLKPVFKLAETAGRHGVKMDLDRPIAEIFRDESVPAYVKKKLHDVFIDEFIESFYSPDGENYNKRHVYGEKGQRTKRNGERREINVISDFFKLSANLNFREAWIELLQLYDEGKINILHVEGEKPIIDAHASRAYGINVCDTYEDIGKAIVHEVMGLVEIAGLEQGFTDDAFNERVAASYAEWREKGESPDIEKIREAIKERYDEVIDKTYRPAALLEITDIYDDTYARPNGAGVFEFRKRKPFSDKNELEKAMEPLTDIIIALPAGIPVEGLRASRYIKNIIRKNKDSMNAHMELTRHIPSLVATCDTSDAKLNELAKEYLMRIMDLCVFTSLDTIFFQFQSQNIEILYDLRDKFNEAYLADWTSSPERVSAILDVISLGEKAPLYELCDMEIRLKEIAAFCKRAMIAENRGDRKMADVAYKKAYELFRRYIRKFAQYKQHRETIEKGFALSSLNIFDYAATGIDEVIKIAFSTIYEDQERFKAAGIELGPVERVYAEYCVTGNRQLLKDFSIMLLMLSVEERDFAKLNGPATGIDKEAHATGFRDIIMVRAKEAKDGGKKLIVGIGTSWIPGYERGNSRHDPLQHKGLNPIFSELANSRLSGVAFVYKPDSELAEALMNEAEETNTDYKHIVALTGETFAEGESFEKLREGNAFIAGVGAGKFKKAGFTPHIWIFAMLKVAIALSSERPALNDDTLKKEYPYLGFKRVNKRRITFEPDAERINFKVYEFWQKVLGHA